MYETGFLHHYQTPQFQPDYQAADVSVCATIVFLLLISVRRTQVANYPLRIPVLLSVNGAELQFNVRQCIYGNRNEAGQLSKRNIG